MRGVFYLEELDQINSSWVIFTLFLREFLKVFKTGAINYEIESFFQVAKFEVWFKAEYWIYERVIFE